MRIAFIADPSSPGGWYRGIGPMAALSQRGYHVVQLWRGEEGIRGELTAGCDLLYVYRAHGDTVQQIVRAAKQQGIAIVFDNDDDLCAVPKNSIPYKGRGAHRGYGGFAGERALRQIRRLLQQADLVVAASDAIASRFREHGAARVWTIENYVPDAALEASAPPNGATVVAGWLAGGEHHLDVERLPLREAWGRALDAHPQLVIETIGVSLGLRHDRYRHIDRVKFRDVPLALARFDIGLAPIADIPFNRARSSIKVKEYAALGRPWLASPVGAYAPLGERQGGRLVPDDCWADALGRLLEKPRERRKLAKQARRWGRAQTLSANVARWEEAIEAALADAGRSHRLA